MRVRSILLGAILSLTTVAAASSAPPPISWIKPSKPFLVAGNLYYVGSQGLSAWLITTPDGHILIDGPMKANTKRIEANIEALGFRLKDVKVLLNSHAHFDHAAGLAQLKRDTGAMLAASEGDRESLEKGIYPGAEKVRFLRFPPVKVDRVLKDGDTVSLGGVTLTANMTPGHSPGCTTWTFPLKVDGKVRKVVYYCSTTVAANRLAPREQYPGIVADYRATFVKLTGMRADIFLAPHNEQFDLDAKRARLKPGSPNPFIDPAELQKVVAASRVAFEKELAKQQAAAS